jgi:nickel/cobalt transporter (NiCoT) family protein
MSDRMSSLSQMHGPIASAWPSGLVSLHTGKDRARHDRVRVPSDGSAGAAVVHCDDAGGADPGAGDVRGNRWAARGRIFILFVFVVPSHYKGLGIGVAVLAYTLGLRHAFDADHISAIDNTTRKVLGERQGTGQPRPFGFGFFFSLGHSSVVVAMGTGIIVAEKTVFAAVSDSGSPLERFGGLFGTVVSASFLFLIGLLNLVVLAGIVRVFTAMRQGQYDEAELERQLAARGLFYRFFGRWMTAISKEWQLYPVGVLFGLGFDTATEVALLATTALLAAGHIPWYAIACLPVLFTAGMTVMDTADGLFINLAYGWAFFNPVRKDSKPRHHRPIGGYLLLHRRDRDPQPDPV